MPGDDSGSDDGEKDVLIRKRKNKKTEKESNPTEGKPDEDITTNSDIETSEIAVDEPVTDQKTDENTGDSTENNDEIIEIGDEENAENSNGELVESDEEETLENNDEIIEIHDEESAENSDSVDNKEGEEESPSLEHALALIGNSDNTESEDISETQDDENEISKVDQEDDDTEDNSESVESEDEDFTLKKLVHTLLAKETLPHLLLLVIASSALFIFAKLDAENSGIIAISYIALSIGYTAVALTSSNEKVYSILQAKTSESNHDKKKVGIPIQNKLMRISKSWLKAWLLPLAYTGIIFGIMLALFGKDSRLEEIGNMLPIILGGFFIAWSATQAISFKNSVVASIKRKTETDEVIETLPKTLFANIAQMLIIVGFSAILVIIFYHYLQGAEGEVTDVFKGEGGIFLAIVLGMVLLLQNSTRSMRIIAGHRKSTSRFTFWWSLILGLFMSWHLLSIYRRVVGAEDGLLMVVEEIALMIFTVLMTIWSLSSRGISEGSKLFTKRNVLFWGLSFGFGYAGSITMVTVIVGQNVNFVIGIGHGVTLLTLLILHRSAIKKALKDAELMNSEGEFTITPKKGW